MKGSLCFLGTGSSVGIPVIGCECSVCKSSLLKNKRLRSSCLIEIKNKKFLLDVSPDFRYQALKYKIKHFDGLILTHAHYDHIGGLDDLRIFYILNKKPIPCMLSEDTLQELKRSFHYLFEPMSKDKSLSTQLDFLILEKDCGKISFQGIDFEYLSYFQKKTKITGYKIGNLAYITDIKEFSEEIYKELDNIDILILSALREDFSPMHFNLKEALAFALKTKAKIIYFTHVAHEIEHEKISKELPPNVFLAYDGLKIEFEYE